MVSSELVAVVGIVFALILVTHEDGNEQSKYHFIFKMYSLENNKIVVLYRSVPTKPRTLRHYM